MRRLAYAALAAAGLLLLLGLAIGRGRRGARNHIPLPLRMLSSALVWLAALLLARGGDRAARLTAAGMGCGFAGDLIMAEVLPLPQHVIFGMLAFGAGHGCYLRAFRERSGGTVRPAASLLLAAPVSALGWRLLARNPAKGAALNNGALGYALLLGTMAASAARLGRHAPRYRPVALGGALFFLSDLLLAAELFRDWSWSGSGDVIWLTYLAGQGLIVGGMGR